MPHSHTSTSTRQRRSLCHSSPAWPLVKVSRILGFAVGRAQACGWLHEDAE